MISQKMLEEYRKSLEEDVARLERKKKKEHPSNAVEGLERGDGCTVSAYEIANLNYNAINAQLADRQAALDRMHEGSYGICIKCKKEIEKDRLSILPWASTCASCERNQKKTGIRAP